MLIWQRQRDVSPVLQDSKKARNFLTWLFAQIARNPEKVFF